MAERVSPTPTREPEDKEGSPLECHVCYQTAVHPVRLTCNHIFCFLCAKGIAARTKKCALCRKPIPPGSLDNPDLLDKSDLLDVSLEEDRALWFYEARSSGWWLYEKRTAQELEQRYQENPKAVFDLLIVGFLYTIDFENMQQYRKDNRAIRRAIKRDCIKGVEIKGQAGIRLVSDAESRSIPGESEEDAGQTADLNQLIDNLQLDDNAAEDDAGSLV